MRKMLSLYFLQSCSSISLMSTTDPTKGFSGDCVKFWDLSVVETGPRGSRDTVPTHS